MPAFYNMPETLDDMVNHVVMRILDQFDISLDLVKRWDGEMQRNVSSVRSIKTKEV